MKALDRIIHGRTADNGEIVRYARAGKWCVEYEDRQRRHVTVGRAAELARGPGGQAWLGLPGGGRFDALVKREGPQGV